MAQHSDGAVVVSTKIDNSGVGPGVKRFEDQVKGMETTVRNAGKDMAASTTSYLRALERARGYARTMAGDQKTLTQEINKTSAALTRLEDRQEKMRFMSEKNRDRQIEQLRKEYDAQMKAQPGFENMSDAAKERIASEYAKDLQAAIDKLPKVEDSRAWDSLQYDIDATRAKLEALREVLEEVSATDANTASATAQAASAQGQIAEAAGAAARSAEEEYQALLRAGSAISDARRNMERAAGINSGDVFEEAAEAEEKLPAIEDAITQALRRRENEYRAVIARIEEAEAALHREREAAQGVEDAAAETAQSTEKGASGWDRVLDVTDAIEGGANRAASALADGFSAMRTAAGGAVSFLGTMAKLAESAGAGLLELGYRAVRAAVHITKIVGSAAINGLKRLASGAFHAAVQLARLVGTGIRNGIKGLGTVISKAANATAKLFQRTKQTNGGINLSLKNVLRYGFGIRSLFALFNRLRRAIKDGFEQMAKSNPEVKASLKSLSAALNGLKGSLASAFAPILTAVAPALTTLINILTTATNAVGMFMAALTGKAYYQAAKGVSTIGSAASSSTGKAKELKRELAGFDQLDILKDSSSGGGGSGGSGSGMTFETLPVENGIKDFVENMKTLFQEGDFDAIGQIIANGINGAIAKARAFISWDNLGDGITQGINAVTGIFNGLVDNIDWVGIGQTFGDGANTFVNTVKLAFAETNFENLGAGLANALNGLVDTVDWDNLGQMFKTKIESVLDFLTSAVKGFKWGKAGKAFAKTVKGLYDKGTFDNLSELLSSGINGAVEMLTNAVDSFSFGKVGTDFATAINKLNNKVKWGDLGALLKNGINSALETLLGFVKEFKWGKVGTAFASTIMGLYDKGTFNKLSDLLSTGINGTVEALTNVINAFEWGQAGREFAASINKLVDRVDWGELGSLLKGALNAALETLLGIAKEFQWGDAGTAFANAVKGLYDKGTFDNLSELLSTGINGATAALGEAVSGFEWGNAGTDFAASVNKLVDDVDWKALGKTLGKAMQTSIDVLKNFVVELDWTEAGKNFATSLNNLVSEIKPEDIGEFISSTLKGAIDWTAAFLQDFDAYDFGVKINQAFASIDWDDIRLKLGNMIQALFSDFGDIVVGAIVGSDIFGDNIFTDFLELIYPGAKEQLASLKKNGLSYSDAKNLASGGKGPDIVDVNERQTKASATQWGRYALQEFNKGRGKQSIIQEIRDLGKSAEEIKNAAYALGVSDDQLNKWLDEFDFGDAWGEMLNGQSAALDVSTTFFASADPTVKNQGIFGWFQRLFAPGTDTETRVKLLKQGWDTVSGWVGGQKGATYITQAIGLVTNAWTTVSGWVSGKKGLEVIPQLIGLGKSGWDTVTSWMELDSPLLVLLALMAASEGKQTAEDVYSDEAKSVKGRVSMVKGSIGQQLADGVYTVQDKAVEALTRLKKGSTGNQTAAAVYSQADRELDAWVKMIKAASGAQTAQDVYSIEDRRVTGRTQLAKGNSGAQTAQDVYSLADRSVTGRAQLAKGNSGAQSVSDVYSSSEKAVSGKVSLEKNGWTSIADFVGTSVRTVVNLSNSGSNWVSGLAQWITGNRNGTVSITTNLVAGAVTGFAQSIKKVFFSATGGIATANGLRAFAGGGIITSGAARYLSNVPHYASGTTSAHGTVFVAGEAGPEIMGHINGRTEILNRSQIAQAVYGAVVAGMGQAVNALGRYLAERMAVCTNAIISTLDVRMPVVATGTLMPYEVSAQIARSTADIQGTLDANNEDLIQTIISVAGQIVAAVRASDKAGAGVTGGPTASQLIDEINRRTLMMGTSPIMS